MYDTHCLSLLASGIFLFWGSRMNGTPRIEHGSLNRLGAGFNSFVATRSLLHCRACSWSARGLTRHSYELSIR
ncbi:hypothetical protein BJX76DRAFT_120326 [Aspergillus varians]